MCIQVILLLLEIHISIQVVYEIFVYFRPFFHRRMQRNSLAIGLCVPPGPVAG